ncbi:MAG: hypothetical protein KatS3mg037_1550 [Ignavibacterium sp.]|nr:MAG: hypothetical protein KatS3mg037_1550 [Ignavibacterium sp.]
MEDFTFSNMNTFFYFKKDKFSFLIFNEDLNEYIKYILYNPVKNNILDDWLLYPYKGSTVFELKDWEKFII